MIIMYFSRASSDASTSLLQCLHFANPHTMKRWLCITHNVNLNSSIWFTHLFMKLFTLNAFRKKLRSNRKINFHNKVTRTASLEGRRPNFHWTFDEMLNMEFNWLQNTPKTIRLVQFIFFRVFLNFEADELFNKFSFLRRIQYILASRRIMIVSIQSKFHSVSNR